MIRRPNRRAISRAEEETTGLARHEVNDWFKQRGEDFWHSVWKRIESGQSQPAPGRRVRDMSPEVPRDYVVDNEARV
jgi:hypothetical protein